MDRQKVAFRTGPALALVAPVAGCGSEGGETAADALQPEQLGSDGVATVGQDELRNPDQRIDQEACP